MNNYLINDFVDLSKTEKVVLEDGSSIEKKTPITKDSFYSNQPKIQQEPIISNDSKKITNSKGKKRYFGVLSCSDKEINRRSYDYNSWKNTVLDGTWVSNPYAKPILRNHNLDYGTPVGRVTDSFFRDNLNGDMVSSFGNTIPRPVLDYFQSKKCFDNSTGTLMVEFNPDELTADRINNGLDVTLSQSSMVKSLKCNICDGDYWGEACDHLAGNSYEVEDKGIKQNKKCVVKASDFTPVELSIVNHPANDVSIIYVYEDEENTETVKKDSQIDEISDLSQNDKEQETKEIVKTEVQDLFKNIAKDHFRSQIFEKFKETETVKESFDKLFDSLSEEQVEVFFNFFKEIEPKTDEVEEAVEEKAVEEKVEEKVAEEKKEDSAETDEVVESSETDEVEEIKTDNKEIEEKVVEDKEQSLKKIFADKVASFEKPIEDKEILAYLNNYKF